MASLIDGDLLAMVKIEFGLPWPILILMLVGGFVTGRILQRLWPKYSPFRRPDEHQ